MTFSKSKLSNNETLELLKFCYLLNCEKLKNEFNKVNIKITKEEDLNSIAEICANKYDVEGKLKDANGNPMMFDTMRILENLKFSEQENELAKTFTYND